MGTINAASSTNNSNTVIYSYSTAIDRHTAWKVSATYGRGAVIAHSVLGEWKLRNLGVTVTASNPFTNKTS
jgi:hypothetical protein